MNRPIESPHMARVAVYANLFDPPTVHHRWVAEQLCGQFDRTVIVPCGPRRLGPIPESRPIHRATMTDLNLRGRTNLRVDLTDLEQNRFTPNIDLAARCAEPG